MKLFKSLIMVLLFMSPIILNAQCTPDPAYSGAGPGVYPLTPVLTPGCVGSPYSQTLTVKVPADTVIFGLTFTFQYVQVVSLTGLPPGLSLNCNYPNCQYPGNTFSCAEIAGTPTTPGTYQITFITEAQLSGIFPYTQRDTFTDYYTIVINDAPTADAGADQLIGGGGSTVIGGSPSASGGTAPYSYMWTPMTDLSSSTVANPTASPSSTTTYSLEVTDINGCSDNDNVVVYVDPCPVVTGLLNEALGTSSWKLKWTPSASAQGYIIQGRRLGTLGWLDIPVDGGAAFKQNVFGLTPGLCYEWRIKAICDSTTGLISSASVKDTFCVPSIPCDAPDSIWTSNMGNNNVQLNWSASANAQRYEIEGRQVGTTTFKLLKKNNPGTTKPVTGLSGGTSYEWRVRAVCDALGYLMSPWTDLDTFTTTGGGSRYGSFDPIMVEGTASVYPNPVTNTAVLEFDNMNAESFDVYITDITGRVIKSWTGVTANRIPFTKEEMAPGVYLYNVTGSYTATGKFIVE